MAVRDASKLVSLDMRLYRELSGYITVFEPVANVGFRGRQCAVCYLVTFSYIL